MFKIAADYNLNNPVIINDVYLGNNYHSTEIGSAQKYNAADKIKEAKLQVAQFRF